MESDIASTDGRDDVALSASLRRVNDAYRWRLAMLVPLALAGGTAAGMLVSRALPDASVAAGTAALAGALFSLVLARSVWLRRFERGAQSRLNATLDEHGCSFDRARTTSRAHGLAFVGHLLDGRTGRVGETTPRGAEG